MLSIILSLAILTVTAMTSVSAAVVPEADIEEMADALNKLNILQGANGDYMLTTI